MTNASTTLPKRGQTLLSGAGRTLASTGQATALEGRIKEFPDIDSESTETREVLRSQRPVTMVLVRNVSGTTLYRGRICRWASGYRGKRVDGYGYVDHEEVAGVVDECVSSNGVVNNDLFWMAVKGPHLIRKSPTAGAENLITAGDLLTALTAASSQAVTAGFPQPAIHAATTNVTNVMSIAINQIGRAMSSSTTNQTGTSATSYLLADLDIMK